MHKAKSEQKRNEEREADLLEQLPAELEDGMERGERIVTGKTIAEGGQIPSKEKQKEET